MRVKFERHNIEATPRYNFGRYKVYFRDKDGNEYDWVPKWDELHKIYQVRAITEILNEGKYEELAKFLHRASGLITTIIEEVTTRLTGGRIDLKKGAIDLGILLEALRERQP